MGQRRGGNNLHPAVPLALALLQPPAQQIHVAAVGAPHHVEHVAGERHRSDHAVERDVPQHARDQPARRAERARLPDDVEREQRRHHVADAGHEPDQRIDAEPNVGARDHDRGVEQGRECVEPRDPLGAGGRGVEKDIVAAGCAHAAQMGSARQSARPRRAREAQPLSPGSGSRCRHGSSWMKSGPRGTTEPTTTTRSPFLRPFVA